MIDKENQPTEPTTPGVASSSEPTPAPSPTVAPKVEVKDGSILVDGKKMVAESDLIAAKRGLETAAEKAQATHNETMDAKMLELSAALQTIADLNAKATENEQARQSGAVSEEDATRVKQELDAAKSSIESLQANANKALEYRRALLIAQFSIPADSLKDKTMQELDSFEEAAKALSTSRGGSPGPYALGGGLGGAAPKTEEERAAQVISDTPIRGVREPAESTTK